MIYIIIMGIVKKLVLLVSIISILYLILFSSVVYYVESVEMRENSERLAEEKVKTFEKILDVELSNLQKFCIDWAVWDDTYEFVYDLNTEYVESNLVESTFLDANLNAMIFVRRDGEIVYSKFYDLNWEEKEVPKELLEVLDKIEKDKPTTAIIMLDRPLLIASSPILRSDWSGEIRGWLVMARYVTDDWLESVEDVLNANIYFEERADYVGPVVVKSFKIESLSGYIPVTIEFENIFYRSFVNSLYSYLIYTVAIVAIVAISLTYLANRYVVSRILNLEKSVSKGEKAEEDDINDEISSLIRNYNRMLEKIKESEEELRFLFRILRHDLMNALTAATGYLDVGGADALEKVKSQLERCFKIIQTIKSLEYSEPKKYRISDVIELIRRFHDVEVVMKGDAEVLADDGIYVIFENLIGNAVKHGKATKVFVDVKVNGEVEIYFWDNGSGFPDDAKDWIFDVKKSRGLGLLIVKRLVEKYGGSIEFLGGSKFLIKIPSLRYL